MIDKKCFFDEFSIDDFQQKVFLHELCKNLNLLMTLLQMLSVSQRKKIPIIKSGYLYIHLKYRVPTVRELHAQFLMFVFFHSFIAF